MSFCSLWISWHYSPLILEVPSNLAEFSLKYPVCVAVCVCLQWNAQGENAGYCLRSAWNVLLPASLAPVGGTVYNNLGVRFRRVFMFIFLPLVFIFVLQLCFIYAFVVRLPAHFLLSSFAFSLWVFPHSFHFLALPSACRRRRLLKLLFPLIFPTHPLVFPTARALSPFPRFTVRVFSAWIMIVA